MSERRAGYSPGCVTAPNQGVWTVELPGYVPGWRRGGNSRDHWTVRARAVDDARDRVWLALLGRDWPLQQPTDPAWTLTITMHRPRFLDPDNAYSACKLLVDALRCTPDQRQWSIMMALNVPGHRRITGSPLWDDSARYLALEVRQVKAPKLGQKTVIEMWEG